MARQPDGHWNASLYGENVRFVSDLGCGDGALTARLVEQGCAVVGVDSSEDMVSAARALLCDAAGRWTADCARLRFAAAKPPPRGA